MRTIDYYYRQRNAAIEWLGGKCITCGSIEQLEIDHIDWRTKEVNLGREWNHPNWWTEIKTKCQLLCHDCHKEKTRRDQREIQSLKGFTHGTVYGWLKKKCECDFCQDHKRAWNAERNAKRRTPGSRGPYNQPAEHGTKRRYSRGCKCDLCRKANADCVREQRKLRPH